MSQEALALSLEAVHASAEAVVDGEDSLPAYDDSATNAAVRRLDEEISALSEALAASQAADSETYGSPALQSEPAAPGTEGAPMAPSPFPPIPIEPPMHPSATPPVPSEPPLQPLVTSPSTVPAPPVGSSLGAAPPSTFESNASLGLITRQSVPVECSPRPPNVRTRDSNLVEGMVAQVESDKNIVLPVVSDSA